MLFWRKARSKRLLGSDYRKQTGIPSTAVVKRACAQEDRVVGAKGAKAKKRRAEIEEFSGANGGRALAESVVEMASEKAKRKAEAPPRASFTDSRQLIS